MSTVLTFNAISIPEFLAGFMYGIYGENNLAEIQRCYEGGDAIYEQVELALSELHEGTKDMEYQGILNFGLVAMQVPTALHKCREIGDDVQSLEQWLDQFLHAKELLKHLTEGLMLHRKEIRADLMQTKGDWDAHLWYTTGADVAKLCTAALGPITPYDPYFLQ